MKWIKSSVENPGFMRNAVDLIFGIWYNGKKSHIKPDFIYINEV